MSPSSERGLDSRRLNQVVPRDLNRDDYSLDSFRYRVQHRRLVELLGEAETIAFEQRLYDWRKGWAH